MFGPKGLRLPVWTPEIAECAKRVEEEHALRALDQLVEENRRAG